MERAPFGPLDIPHVLAAVRDRAAPLEPALVTAMEARGEADPFRVLIATILSLRTKDETTGPAATRLFERAATPEAMLDLEAEEIQRLVFPVGFYKVKSRTILEVCAILVEKHGGRVPDTLEGLLALPGVGRKTANLVIIKGFGGEGICVDTHVHRVANRWGLVSTKHADATEMALREVLPREHWEELNDLLVVFGKHVCKPLSPHCSTCPLQDRCPRIGVDRHR